MTYQKQKKKIAEDEYVRTEINKSNEPKKKEEGIF